MVLAAVVGGCGGACGEWAMAAEPVLLLVDSLAGVSVPPAPPVRCRASETAASARCKVRRCACRSPARVSSARSARCRASVSSASRRASSSCCSRYSFSRCVAPLLSAPGRGHAPLPLVCRCPRLGPTGATAIGQGVDEWQGYPIKKRLTPFQWRDRQSLNLELKLLFRRASPFKERCSMVDAASKPARTLLRSSTRAHPEVGMLIVDASREMAVCTCQPAVVREEPRGECTFTELVLSSSFGDTHTVFAQSGVLRSRFFPCHPLGV